MQLEEERKIQKKEEEGQSDYSDDSFEQESSEEDRTPTFEFNMSSPSIGNSGCEDLNEVLPNLKIRRIEDEDIASDQSEIENDPFTCEESESAPGGALRSKQSCWKFFDEISRDTNHEAGKDEICEADEAIEEHLESVEVIEMNNDSKLAVDKELDRMDEEIFGLLRPSPQSSKDRLPGAQRESIVYPGDEEEENVSTGTDVRKRKVRITIEPEVFLVPFSSREFDEPSFEDTDSVSPENQFESRFKHLNLNPLSQECGDEPYEGVTKGTREEMSLEEADHDEEDDLAPGSNGFYKNEKKPLDGFKIEEPQSASEVNISDENELSVNEWKTEDTFHSNKENISFKKDGNREDMSSCGVQKESVLQNVHLDRYSVANDAEDGIQEERSLNVATKVDHAENPGANGVNRQDIKPKNGSNAMEERQLPSESNVASENEITIEKMGCGNYLFSKNISVESECNKDLPGQKNLTSKGVNLVPYTSKFMDEVDNSLESVEEDIPEEIISDDNDLDKATDTEPWNFDEGCSAGKIQAAAVIETELPCQMCFDGRDSQYPEETKMGHENESRNKSARKADEKVVLKHDEQETSSVLQATPNHKLPAAQFSMALVSHDKNEDLQPNGDEVNTVTHRTDIFFLEDTDTSGPTFLPGANEQQDILPDGNLVSMSMKFENNTKETEQGNEADDEAELEDLAQSAKDTESSLKKDKMKIDLEWLHTLEDLRAEVKTLKEHNEELKLELEEKSQENYTIQCIIKSVSIENEKLLDQVESFENELKTALSEKENVELELVRGSSQEAATPEQTSVVADKLGTEIKSLKKHNEQLRLQLEESDMQRRNMESIVEQLNVENEKLLENMDGLETALSQQRANEVELEDHLKEAKKEHEKLRNRSKDINSEIAESNKEEIKDIAAELGRLKELHAKIVDMRMELCGKEEAVIETSLAKTEASQSRLSLLQELNAVVLSVVQMSEEFKDTMLQVLEDSAQHKKALDADLKEIKEEYLKTLDKQNMEIKSLRMYKEDLEIQLEGTSAMEERSVEINRLKKQNEQLKLQLEECDVQRKNMDCIVEQLNIEKDELLENMYGLESVLSQKKASELDLKEFLEEAEKENETLRDRLKDIEIERTGHNEAEIMGIAAELQKLKTLHAKIDDIRKRVCGEKEVVLEKCWEKTETSQSRLSLLQELRGVMLSVAEMSDDLKHNMLEDQSAQHKMAVHAGLAEVKEECLKTSDEQNTEIKSLRLQNEELKGLLEESKKERQNVECQIESVNAENEKLLERIHVLENKLDAALNEKKDIEKELSEKNSKDEYRERELSNLRETLRRKTFHWEEMDASLDQLWNDKQKLEEELGFMTVSLEESEASKSELVREMNRTKLQFEKLKDQQAEWNNKTDYASLRDHVEQLKASLSLSSQNEACLKKELKSTMARTSSIGNDPQQKDRYKIRIEELERENTLLLQKIARSFVCEEKSENASKNLEKEIKMIQEELHKFRDESIHTLRNVCGGKIGYKKLKKRLIRNEEGIKSFAKSFQKDIQEKKDMDNELRGNFQNDFEQIKSLLKQVTENKLDEKKENASEERLVKQMKELKSVLETTLLNVQKNESECAINRCNLNLQIQKSQELESNYQELNKRLQEMEYELDVNKRILKEKDDRIEELNLQLHNEKEDKIKSLDAAESKSRQRIMDKEGEINSLRRLIADSDDNSQNIKGKLMKITKDFESTKETLAQRDKELASAKASLCEGDQLLHTFRTNFTGLRSELEEAKRVLIEKSVALEYTERYTEMLFKSARTKDYEIEVTNELVTKVAQNVDRVEKLLEKEILATVKAANESCQGTTTENELSGDQSNEGNTKNSLKSQLRSVLEGKDKTIQQLESALSQLKQDLEMTSASLQEKDNDMQQVVSAFNKQEKELEISNGRRRKLEDETHSLRNELTQMNTLLSQQDDEINELKELVATRDSQLKTESGEVEKLKILLKAKENCIERMKDDLAEEEHERKSLTEHLKKKMAEITRLQEALDIMKMEPCKSPPDYPGIIAHIKMSGQSEKDLEGLKKELGHKVSNDKEGEINHCRSATAKVEKDMAEKNVLQPGKNEQLTKTNLGDTRLRQLEETFEAYKQNASEKASKLKKESNALEEKFNNVEIHFYQQQKEFKRQEQKVTEWGGNCNPVHANIHQEERSSRSVVNEEKELLKVEMAQLAGKQIANAMTDRMHQMVTDMYAMQMELDNQRDEYSTLTNKNKHLKERVEKLENQGLKKDKIHYERLNNVLDNVRMKRKEIQGLKSLLRETSMPEVSSH